MGWFSWVASTIFLLYVGNSIWTIMQLFYIPSCSLENPSSAGSRNAKSSMLKCIPSWLYLSGSENQLALYGYPSSKTTSLRPEALIYINNTFNPNDYFQSEVNITLPKRTLNNGTFYLYMVLLKQRTKTGNVVDLSSSDVIAYTISSVTDYAYPKLEALNLMGAQSEKNEKDLSNKLISHLRSRVTLSVMADDINFHNPGIPNELIPLMRLDQATGSYLPILLIDDISFRLRDLVKLDPEIPTMTLTVIYQPISAGKLRLWQSIKGSFLHLKQLGFGEKEVDEVKGIFADTNFFFLMLTFVVSAVHILFDVLAFKNDISYWRNRTNMVGLSTRAVIWRCVSTIIIFFYLLDEETSLLVLVPTGISALIEIWKMKKAFKVSISSSGIKFGLTTDKEKETEQFDATAMSYLSYLLIPLLIGGAIYSLIYTPHKSWYSWCVKSLVNGVYAFGFLFMLPQLFVNYKLKSVAHLPWKAFMYKAFNTFIDDLFAFIITMPTSHRLACFRDDVIFIIYLYQRWLYPVDKSRINEFGQTFDNGSAEGTKEKKE